MHFVPWVLNNVRTHDPKFKIQSIHWKPAVFLCPKPAAYQNVDLQYVVLLIDSILTLNLTYFLFLAFLSSLLLSMSFNLSCLLLPFASFLWISFYTFFHPLRPSLTPARCVTPPPAWSRGALAEAWGWTTTPWRGWCLKRGDMVEDADTGTEVTEPHSAPWPDTQMQTRVSQCLFDCWQKFSNFQLDVFDWLICQSKYVWFIKSP